MTITTSVESLSFWKPEDRQVSKRYDIMYYILAIFCSVILPIFVIYYMPCSTVVNFSTLQNTGTEVGLSDKCQIVVEPTAITKGIQSNAHTLFKIVQSYDTIPTTVTISDSTDPPPTIKNTLLECKCPNYLCTNIDTYMSFDTFQLSLTQPLINDVISTNMLNIKLQINYDKLDTSGITSLRNFNNNGFTLIQQNVPLIIEAYSLNNASIISTGSAFGTLYYINDYCPLNIPEQNWMMSQQYTPYITNTTYSNFNMNIDTGVMTSDTILLCSFETCPSTFATFGACLSIMYFVLMIYSMAVKRFAIRIYSDEFNNHLNNFVAE
jgi:hypothetical protein